MNFIIKVNIYKLLIIFKYNGADLRANGLYGSSIEKVENGKRIFKISRLVVYNGNGDFKLRQEFHEIKS